MVKNLNQLPEINDVLDFDESLFEVVGTSEESLEKLESAPYSYWRSVGKQLMKNKVAIACIIIASIFILLTIFGPLIYDISHAKVLENLRPVALDPFSSWTNNKGESFFFILGTDFNGRDLWSQIWIGAQFSLKLAVVVALIDVVVGLVIGGLWGYIRALDPIMIEISNVISNIPSLLIYVMVLEILPNSGESESAAFWNSVIVMSMFGWLGLASTLRNQIIIIRNREFNIASECLGSSPFTIITHNLLPQLISIISQIVIDYIPACISTEVSLIFFGAFPISQTSLGQVVNNAYTTKNITKAIEGGSLHTLIVPAVVMMLLTISFFYFGLAVADATDPKKHR